METGRKSIPEPILVEIIARLPLRSIARLKSVCKQWRSFIESSYFRSLFVSLHRNSSSSWSLMFIHRPFTEAIGFHGCERWALPKSPASYFIFLQQYLNLPILDYYYVDSSHGLVWIEVILDTDDSIKYKSLVGNPVSQEWVEIPPPPDPVNIPSNLMTRLVNGVVSSFKVVRTSHRIIEPIGRRCVWRVYVYSSETGTWTFKQLRSSFPLQRTGFNKPLNLNGMLYLWDKRPDDDDDDTDPGVLVAYDFYGEEDDDQLRIIPLPGPHNKYVSRCLSNSGGDVIYIEILYGRLKVWKLKKSNNSNGEWWQLTREEINMASDVNCFPLGMNPFDTDLVYLWSRQHSCVVSGNLRTQEFTLHQETETWSDSEGCWLVNTSDSKKHMEALYDPTSVVTLSQFVLPQWMDPVPRPPN